MTGGVLQSSGHQDRNFLLTLYCNPDVLRIGALLPGITRQGLGGSGKLIRLGYLSHVVDVTLEVLCQSTEGHYFWPYRGQPFVLPSSISVSLLISPFDLWFCRGSSLASISRFRLGENVDW